jgi:Nif-specific regulatory protein
MTKENFNLNVNYQLDSSDLKELKFLFEISMTLNSSYTTGNALLNVLKLTSLYTDMPRLAITILSPDRSKIFIEEAFGLSEAEKARGQYLPGEGIIGKVISEGNQIIIPKIEEEPIYLNRTGVERTGDSMICVPIKTSANKVIGTLSADGKVNDFSELEQKAELLNKIASILAVSIDAQRHKIEEIERLQKENTDLQDKLKVVLNPVDVIGNSPVMNEVYRQINKVSDIKVPVILRGECGVGKEIIASAIHYNGPDAKEKFIKVNCSALPERLIDYELFGGEMGEPGAFELAGSGTVFLNEIANLSPMTQVKILRILQEGVFEKNKTTQLFRNKARIIGSTNQNLEKLVAENQFRQDLFYRINVFPVFIPPLKERKSDIPILVEYFIREYNKNHEQKIRGISSSAVSMLMNYDWPGNVRELENCINRAAVLSTNGVIRDFNMPLTIQVPTIGGTDNKWSLTNILEKIEKELICETLKMTRGNMAKAANYLGITERIMGLRIKKYSIKSTKFKKNGQNSINYNSEKADCNRLSNF